MNKEATLYKFLKKSTIGLSFQNGKSHCFVIFWPSYDLGRKVAFFYSTLICFLKPLLAVEPGKKTHEPAGALKPCYAFSQDCTL